MEAVVAAFNQEEALVGAFSVIVKTDFETDGSFTALVETVWGGGECLVAGVEMSRYGCSLALEMRTQVECEDRTPTPASAHARTFGEWKKNQFFYLDFCG